MKNLKKLTREEMKNVSGGKFHTVIYTCNDGSTIEMQSPACDTASHVCDSNGGVKFCNG
ncbi:bacteriocin-like protein [Mucilaginibacter achroorhodeus]|uniref:bacteriocin-like protein n=1 Tax=Mucilaginibacter achroorhodeus TaxID=2599294 RepID=UPI00164822F6|nr:hypothetical protein [Mucilaginibacter achroorhodeus]